jgi:hypothetical protein
MWLQHRGWRTMREGKQCSRSCRLMEETKPVHRWWHDRNSYANHNCSGSFWQPCCLLHLHNTIISECSNNKILCHIAPTLEINMKNQHLQDHSQFPVTGGQDCHGMKDAHMTICWWNLDIFHPSTIAAVPFIL